MKLIRRFCLYALATALGFQFSSCVLTHTRERSRIVERLPRKELRRAPRVLVIKNIRFQDKRRGSPDSVRLTVVPAPGGARRTALVTREFVSSRGGDFEFVFFYFAFATPEKGVGNYFGKLLLGIPFTLGVNLVIAAGDWISLPFRLGRDRRTRREHDRVPVRFYSSSSGGNFLYAAGRRYRLRDSEVEMSAAAALRTATDLGDESSARRLLAATNINHDYGAGNTLLHFAAIRGDDDALRLLLKLGARPDVRNNSNRTPLHFAARRFSTVCARILLAAGAKAGARDLPGESPLFAAVREGNEKMVELLLARGASSRLRNKNGLRPRDLLNEYPFSNRKRLLEMLERK